jgi:hypothetical protein
MPAPPHDPLELLRAAFDGECRELGLSARLAGDGVRLLPNFEAQFGSTAATLAGWFQEELAARGVVLRDGALTNPADDAAAARTVEALRGALRRTRSRLVDGNSWISGGLPWPFDLVDATVRSRGLATYRAPANAAADVEVGAGLARIRVPQGDCGEIVSAGIWLPTGLAGDFDVSIRYRLGPWRTGTREACLGLFAVAPDGTFRAYAQRVTRGDEPHFAIADLDGAPGPARARCTGSAGTLRIRRDAALVSAWHREDRYWTWLGRIREPSGRALIAGAKVWALGECGPLEARIERFDLAGQAAADQVPPPPARADPRTSPQAS